MFPKICMLMCSLFWQASGGGGKLINFRHYWSILVDSIGFVSYCCLHKKIYMYIYILILYKQQ